MTQYKLHFTNPYDALPPFKQLKNVVCTVFTGSSRYIKAWTVQSCFKFDLEQFCNRNFFSRGNGFQDTKYRKIDFLNFDVLISQKLLHLEKKFQLQSCSKFDFKQLCNWKFCQNIASLAVAKEVFSKVVTIATKILWAIEQIIVSLYMYTYS